MPLKMKAACETCKTPLPEGSSKARICSYERTFCPACAAKTKAKCPHCKGELVARPRRSKKAA